MAEGNFWEEWQNTMSLMYEEKGYLQYECWWPVSVQILNSTWTETMKECWYGLDQMHPGFADCADTHPAPPKWVFWQAHWGLLTSTCESCWPHCPDNVQSYILYENLGKKEQPNCSKRRSNAWKSQVNISSFRNLHSAEMTRHWREEFSASNILV